MNLKKKIMVATITGMMILSASALVLAATPKPADNEVPQAQTTQTATEYTNKRYLTKGGAAIWFIVILLANGAFSFWVGNRFYRMSKKDNHVASEIRALRRDVEEKFAQSIGDFAEKEVEITNTNESLAENEEGIKSPEKNITFDATPEEEERFRRWAQAQSKIKSEPAPKSSVRRDLEENMDEVKKINKKNYQPRREKIKPEKKEDTFDAAEDLGETKVINTKSTAVKNKTKEILNDIFPFKED